MLPKNCNLVPMKYVDFWSDSAVMVHTSSERTVFLMNNRVGSDIDKDFQTQFCLDK